MFIRIIVLQISFFVLQAAVLGESQTEPEVDQEVVRRQTAVALNYCRAALHRIRRRPDKQVFLEEEQRILNNLNLSRINDAEVIALYRAVLDEISQVEVSERERRVIDERFRQETRRQLSTTLFVVGAQAVTGQIGNVIQSGANSWWDYRNQALRRDADLWKVDRTEFRSLMSRSSTFLDSFWKLSRRNNIPDSWLVRDQDLDQLADILKEPDAERRLRMLRRMERFMTCYPPYWYYVARTQQQMGQLDEAMSTYRRLLEVGSGHFRQDDMLAGCLANMALIQEGRGDSAAVQSALRSAEHSTRNWEANLVCAWVLGRHAQYREAEDRLLCNLDHHLEKKQSSVALVSLYYHSEDRSRLAKLLSDEQVAAAVPVPGLLLCARLLGADALPRPASVKLASSLRAEYRPGLRSDVVVLRAAPGWKLRDADPRMTLAGVELSTSGFEQDRDEVVATWHVDAADTDERRRTVHLTLQYPGVPPIQVTLSPHSVPAAPAVGTFPGLRLDSMSRIALGVEAIDVGGVRLSVRDDQEAGEAIRSAQGDSEETVRS